MCRTRKQLATSVYFETTLKYECTNIIMKNPTNYDLTKNLLPYGLAENLPAWKLLNFFKRLKGKQIKGECSNAQIKILYS